VAFRFCPGCGAERRPSASYCADCGRNLNVQHAVDADRQHPRPPLQTSIFDAPKGRWGHGGRYYLVLFILLVGGVSIAGVCLAHGHYSDYGASETWTSTQSWAIFIGIACTIIGGIGLTFATLNRLVGHHFDTAFGGVPDPAEIEQRLWQEWGRQPTPTEVLQTHEFLRHRRNGAAVGVAGAIFVAHEMGKH
jgi:hypothetical protein